jgi:drug/metabolite transporter (DMT)-like permease
MRIWLAAAFFAAFLPAQQKRGLFKGDVLKACLPLALTGIATNLFCFAAGIRLTLPSHSSIIHSLIPVFVAALAWIFLRERQRPLAVLGMALAIGGAATVALSAPAGERRATLAGDLITLAGALAFSCYILLGRRVIPKLGAWRAVATGFVLSVPLSVPFLAWGLLEQDWSRVTWRGWTGAAYMIVGATFFCYSAHMWSLTHLTPLQVSIFVDVQPMLATLIAAGLGQESVTPVLVASGLVALSGVAIVQRSARAPASISSDSHAPRASEGVGSG